MSLSPNSSLVRRTIDLNYANKQRSVSLKWLFINGVLFLLFSLDLWYKCPEYTDVLHCAEGAAAVAALAAAAAHALRMRPRAASPPRRLAPAQQRLLGLRDRDLDSSFCVGEEPPAAAAPSSAPADEEPASLSPPRSWRAAGSPRAPPAAPSPAPPAPRALRDEFIADRAALERYLSAHAAAEGGGAAVAAGGQRAHHSPPAPYQLAPLHSEPGAGEGGAPDAGGGAAGAAVWRRLHLDPQHLAQFSLNLRRWLHATIFERLVRELDACDAALAAAGQAARAGAAAPERLAALAAGDAAPALARRLRALLPYLRGAPDQRAAVGRVRALARGGCLRAYRWAEDAELVLRAFAAYMDGVVPGGGFSAAHVSCGGPPPPPHALAVHRAAERPPHYVVSLGDGAGPVDVGRGRDNLFHSLLVFVGAAARRDPPALCRLHLGPAGLNMLWILGR